MATPLISVMIPTHNREAYITDAIDSILAQDYRPLEIIVVDDGSTDNTAEILKQYDPQIVKYHYQEKAGEQAARNACVTFSTGEFLAWLDSDDLYAPGKLTAQMQYLNEHPDCEIVFTLAEDFYENEELKTLLSNPVHKSISVNNSRTCHATMLARREMVLRVGGRDLSLTIHDDGEWISRITILYGVDTTHCLDAVYLLRRIHENCVSVLTVSKDTLTGINKIYRNQLREKVRNAMK